MFPRSASGRDPASRRPGVPHVRPHRTAAYRGAATTRVTAHPRACGLRSTLVYRLDFGVKHEFFFERFRSGDLT